MLPASKKPPTLDRMPSARVAAFLPSIPFMACPSRAAARLLLPSREAGLERREPRHLGRRAGAVARLRGAFERPAGGLPLRHQPREGGAQRSGSARFLG